MAFKWDFYNYLGYSFDTEKGLIMLLTMPAYYMEQGCNGRASVHLSVPLTDSSSRGQWVCCQVLCGQEILIDTCGGCAAGAGAQQQMQVASCWEPKEEAQHAHAGHI